MSAHIYSLFPSIEKNPPFHITSPETFKYNCISWAYGIDHLKMWPGQGSRYYWPEDLPSDNHIDSFIALFNSVAYFECDDGILENGFLKIALYCSSDGIPTHAARQLSDGSWTSKIGDLEDITHTIEGMADGAYGNVVKYLKREI